MYINHWITNAFGAAVLLDKDFFFCCLFSARHLKATYLCVYFLFFAAFMFTILGPMFHSIWIYVFFSRNIHCLLIVFIHFQLRFYISLTMFICTICAAFENRLNCVVRTTATTYKFNLSKSIHYNTYAMSVSGKFSFEQAF